MLNSDSSQIVQCITYNLFLWKLYLCWKNWLSFLKDQSKQSLNFLHMKKLEHLQCHQYYHNNWLLHTTDYWWKEKLKVSVTVIKQRLEYIYVNFSVQNLLYLTCTTPGMPNFLLVCGSVWVQLDMSPRKACQSIKKFHLFSFLIFWQKYNTPLQWKFSKIKISAKAGKAIFQWLLIWLGKMIQSPFLKSNI